MTTHSMYSKQCAFFIFLWVVGVMLMPSFGAVPTGCTIRGPALNCTGLVKFPGVELMSEVTRLSIVYSDIKCITKAGLKYFPSLTELSLEHCNVQEIEDDAFSELKSLRYLLLPDNNIKSLNTVTMPATLFYLDISKNPLDFTLSSPLPKSAPNLEELYTVNVGMVEIRSSYIKGMKNLRRWRIMRNSLKTLDLGVLVELSQISDIDVEHNKIHTIIPLSSETKLDNLKILDIGYNELTTLNENTLRGLPALEELRLHSNQLLLSAKPFLSHSTLNKISLSRTIATFMSENTFKNLPLLSNIDLTESSVINITSVFTVLPELKVLNLQGNDIEAVRTGSFAVGGKLENLILRNNPLKDFEVAALNGCMSKGTINVLSTPLGCSVEHPLKDWAADKKVVLLTSCQPTTPPPTLPPPTCAANGDCPEKERCCKDRTCSKGGGDCGGATALISLPLAVLLLAAFAAVFKNEP